MSRPSRSTTEAAAAAPAERDFDAERLDKVPQELVAKVKVELLLRRAPPFLVRYLRLLVPDGHPAVGRNGGGGDPVLSTSPCTVATLPPGMRPPSLPRPQLGRAAAAAAALLLQQGFFEQDTQAARDTAWAAHAGLFFVPKGDKLRIITDARPANLLCHNVDLPFRIYSLPDLLDTFASHTAAGSPVHVVSLDLRHWFHQLPLPRRYRRMFRLHFHGRVCTPISLPMGWTLAPAGAQAATLAMLLTMPGGRWQKDLKIHVEVLESMTADGIMPAYIPLRDGGRVFVCLDNVLVVTSDAHCAQQWKTHIARSAAEFDITIKEAADGTSDAIRLQTLSPGSDETLIFNGIEFRYAGCRVHLREGDAGPLPRTFSHRQLSGYLGKILWHIRVCSLPLFGETVQPFMQMYRDTAPQLHEDWDAAVALSAGQQATLATWWDSRNAGKLAAYPVRSRADLSRPTTLAVDAASSGALACVYFEPDFDYYIFRPDASAGGHIAIMELEALVLGIKHAPPDTSCFFALSDSMNVVHWVTKGYARNAAANSLLQQLAELLDARYLGLEYVKSELNAADGPSRADENWNADEWQASTAVQHSKAQLTHMKNVKTQSQRRERE